MDYKLLKSEQISSPFLVERDLKLIIHLYKYDLNHGLQ